MKKFFLGQDRLELLRLKILYLGALNKSIIPEEEHALMDPLAKSYAYNKLISICISGVFAIYLPIPLEPLFSYPLKFTILP